jgi:hypothetical protein
MIGQVERRVEEISGDLNSQDCYKHDVDIYDNGDNRGRGYTDYVTAGAVDGCDIRELKPPGRYKHDVVVSDNRDKVGGSRMIEQLGAVDGGDIRGVQLVTCCNHPVVICLFLCMLLSVWHFNFYLLLVLRGFTFVRLQSLLFLRIP